MGYYKPFDPSDVWSYATRTLTQFDAEFLKNTQVIAHDTIRAEANTERSTLNTSMTKVKEIKVSVTGKIRVWFDLKSAANGYTVEAQIYKNGSAVGTLRQSDTTTYQTYQEDIDVTDGDLVQLYYRTTNNAVDAFVRNFKIGYDITYKSDEVMLD